MNKLALPLLLAATAALGCGHTRTPDQYHDDVMALLATKNDAIKTCYDEALKADPKVQGEVVVSFKVFAVTGVVNRVELIKDQSSAPEALGQCVTGAIKGLMLNPADDNSGNATYTWQFTPKKS